MMYVLEDFWNLFAWRSMVVGGFASFCCYVCFKSSHTIPFRPVVMLLGGNVKKTEESVGMCWP